MRYLLDTCIVLWALDGNRKELKSHLHIIENPNFELAISVVSYWEIVIKKSLGKLEIDDNWTSYLDKLGTVWLHLEPGHVKQLEKLPLIHHDPFDRLLIAQAQADQRTLLTNDEKILQYFR